MKRLCLVLIFLLATTAAVSAKTMSKPHHAKSLHGTVVSVDEPGKMVVVKDSKGKETNVAYTSATKITGGTLKPGEAVTILWMDKDGKAVATTVQIAKP
jgi:hypothetical protein